MNDYLPVFSLDGPTETVSSWMLLLSVLSVSALTPIGASCKFTGLLLTALLGESVFYSEFSLFLEVLELLGILRSSPINIFFWGVVSSWMIFC